MNNCNNHACIRCGVVAENEQSLWMCPACKELNDPDDTTCLYCGHDLPLTETHYTDTPSFLWDCYHPQPMNSHGPDCVCHNPTCS